MMLAPKLDDYQRQLGVLIQMPNRRRRYVPWRGMLFVGGVLLAVSTWLLVLFLRSRP